MKNAKAIGIGVIIVIAVLVSIFTVSSDEVGNWNNKVIKLQTQYITQWNILDLQVMPWFKGEKVDGAKLDAAFANYEKAVKQTTGEMKRTAPPDDESCKAFHASLVDYADIQVTHLPEYRKLLDAMKASNPGSDEEQDRVGNAFDALGKKENALNDVVGIKQSAMANEHGLRLK